MHRIGPDRPEGAANNETKLDREIQKSLWLYLCNQDWFNIPFANAHAISPAHCTTPLPINCDGISGLAHESKAFESMPMDSPTQMTYMLNMFQGACNRRNDGLNTDNSVVADICRHFFDKTAALNSETADDGNLRVLYEHVLTADAQMKTISKTCAPHLRFSLAGTSADNVLLSIQRTAFVISIQNKVGGVRH